MNSKIDRNLLHITEDITVQDALDKIQSINQQLSSNADRLKELLPSRQNAKRAYEEALDKEITILRDNKYPASLLMAKAKSKIIDRIIVLEDIKTEIESLECDTATLTAINKNYISMLSWMKAELLNS